MTESEILEFLRGQKYSTLIRWHDQLNCWTWPDDLPGKPVGYDDSPQYRNDYVLDSQQVKCELHKPIWIALGKLLPHKECLRYHWLNNLKRSEDEFEAWYQTELRESMSVL